MIGFNESYDKTVLKKLGGKDATFEDMIKEVPKDGACYIFINFLNIKLDNGETSNRVMNGYSD